jgi:hypothetical protein
VGCAGDSERRGFSFLIVRLGDKDLLCTSAGLAERARCGRTWEVRPDLGGVSGPTPFWGCLLECPSEGQESLAWLMDRLVDQRGGRGSEWEPIKILLQRENKACAPNSQPRIPTRVYQGRIVTTDVPTLGANLKQSQSESKTQEAKNLAAPRGTRRTVRGDRVDGPRGTGGRSAGHRRTVRK